ncbi:MAG: class I SAM-dependent methyltransferase [Planctomycetes bacterium]|nr:class I SAM-dependent methyltransferase [Planctomycetota bacterium]
MDDLKKTLEKSFEWRFSHFGKVGKKAEKGKNTETASQAIRLFAGTADGVPGLIIDQFGSFLVATLYNPKANINAGKLRGMIEEAFPGKTILVKYRDNQGKWAYLGNNPFSFSGHNICREGQESFRIQHDPNHDFGLFLDTKAARNWLRDHAQGKNILNLFSYTCAFAVAGMCSQAKGVTNIDPNKSYLSWGKKNAELNNTDFRNYEDTTQKYLARHIKRIAKGTDSPYDIIITDPPAFLVGRGEDRLGRKFWPLMLDQLLQCKAQKLLLICNDKAFRKGRQLYTFLNDHIGTQYSFKAIKQSYDILGQNNKDESQPDGYYLPPQVYMAELRK